MHERLALDEHGRGISIKDISFVDSGILVQGEFRSPFLGYWNIKTGQFGQETLEPVKFERILCFSRDGRFLVFQKQGNTAQVWDRVSGKVTGVFQHPAGQPPFCVSDDGKTTVTLEGNQKLAIWDLPTGKQHCELSAGERHCHLCRLGNSLLPESLRRSMTLTVADEFARSRPIAHSVPSARMATRFYMLTITGENCSTSKRARSGRASSRHLNSSMA